jgi:glycosyltransferase involved in cell wall biosynthesis
MPGAKPRVVHVITRLIRGGAQLAVLELCNELRADFDVRVVCGPDEGTEGSIRSEVAAVVPVTVVPTLRREIHPLQDAVALLALQRTFGRLEPDIVHTHSSKAGIVGRWAAAATGARSVHTVHGWGHTPGDSAVRRRVLIGLERAVAGRTDTLVAVSEDVRTEGLGRGIGKPSQYRVIPEFVDLGTKAGDFAGARARARAQLSIDASKETVGWVGRFVPQKDPETLIAALESILRHRHGAQAVLIGDGPLRQRSQQRLLASDIGERVTFAGLCPDARALMPAFDVLLHVSRWEGQPLVLQEAVAERIPVVATQAPGVKDVVIPGRTGYVLAPGDVTGVAERAQDVLDDPGMRAPLPNDEVARVLDGLGRDVSLAGHLSVYRQLLRSSE